MSSCAKSSLSNDTTSVVGKKCKRQSPFRIKAGCIVALRYLPGGNHLVYRNAPLNATPDVPSPSFVEVWTDPLPGRDEGLALVGRLIRCCFPKSVGANRIVEGEIVSLLDFEAEWRLRHQQRRRRLVPSAIKVELLVDQHVLASMPFLQRLDNDDASKELSHVSNAEQKRRRLEEIIRGKNKVSVLVLLADVSTIATKKQKTDHLIAKWVIRKRIALPKPGETWERRVDESIVVNGGSTGKDLPDSTHGGKKQKTNKSNLESAIRYVGDGNVEPTQQERDFRWLAARVDDMTMQTRGAPTDPLRCVQEFSFGFIGEALRVTPSSSSVGYSSSSQKTLAMVTLRRLLLPEQTKRRMPHHGPCDIFDDADAAARTDGEETLFQVPVEELVVLFRRMERRPGHNGRPHIVRKDGEQTNVVSWEYSFMKDTYKPLRSLEPGNGNNGNHGEAHENGGSNKVFIDVCHRCRRHTQMVSRKRLLFNSPAAEDHVDEWAYFCEECNNTMKNLGKEKAGSRFGLQCDCSQCVAEPVVQLESLLTQSIQRAQRIADGVCKSGEGELGNQILANCCGVCGKLCKFGLVCDKCGDTIHKQCSLWDCSLGVAGEMQSDAWATKEGGQRRVRCRLCRRIDNRNGASAKDRVEKKSSVETAVAVLQAMRPVDFDLPRALFKLETLPLPSTKPASKKNRVKGKPRKKRGNLSSKTKPAKSRNVCPAEETGPTQSFRGGSEKGDKTVQNLSENVFNPSCSRLLAYEPGMKRFSGASKTSREGDGVSVESKPTGRVSIGRSELSTRQSRKRMREAVKDEPRMTSRAARANQRRLMKDEVASSLGLDTLSGREQQLRFDRSNIHAWGVFADVDINAGDMVVEYRGELIGNAVAEKREKEYELAKIGSDYMFRIDAHTVCDATKQGNVARFINASCDPNCYTQIVTLNGVKRIVIYAKKDILAGEELCYDYKFPFEFDEAKRIPCHCGAQNCRGFMNWNKRYVAIPVPAVASAPGETSR